MPALAVGLGGAVVALVVIPMLIALQRRRHLGQQVYEDAPKRHAAKQGTPTMGGLAFLAAVVLAAGSGLALKAPLTGVLPLTCLVIAVGLIGFADDALIVIRHHALGLRARWKFGLVLLAAIGYLAWIVALDPQHALNEQGWFGMSVVLPAWALWALALAAIVGASNAVNLTDGLDGLAAGVSLPVLIVLALAAGVDKPVAFIVWAVLGALIVFFAFNVHPARIFMGDTGSLALGALMAGAALQTSHLLLLPLIGIVFVVEALSVIAQVASFRSTGARIFKMSPLHHHFELSGWSERRIVATFSVVSVLAAAGVWLATGGIRGLQLP